MLYGKPTKFIRHVDETEFTLEPERMYVHEFWKYRNSATSRTDGQDLENDPNCPLGSRVTKHKLTMTVTPETIEPQKLYMGIVALSFQDVYHPNVSGGRFIQASYEDTATENHVAESGKADLGLWPDDNDSGATTMVSGAGSAREFGASNTITDILLDDTLKHVVQLKQVDLFDQRPLITNRWQRVPKKVKRINEGTFYGLVLYNDSDRGATPADTQLSFNIKSYWEEYAL